MSDHSLQFIPTDLQFQPSSEAAERARTVLATFALQVETVTGTFNESVEFFHPDSNGLDVHCPVCGADASDWRVGALDGPGRATSTTSQ